MVHAVRMCNNRKPRGPVGQHPPSRALRSFPLTGSGSVRMRPALEQALDRAEEVIARAQQTPPESTAPSGQEKSLHEKLYDIYVEECGKEPEVPEELTTSVNLLEKLVSRESLPCLVFNLYPGDKGCSVMLDDKSGSFSEIISLPYGEGKLLEYLDAQQLPPVLLDILGTSQMNLFHSGCVIAEIRDYRQFMGLGSPVYKSRHILLRPTMQTLVCDVEAIASDNPQWTQQDKLTFERQLILAPAEPLCLEPSVAVACTANRLLFNMQTMNAAPMTQCFKRHSWPSLSLQEESFPHPSHPDSRVLTACRKKKEKKSSQEGDPKITTQNYVDTWKQSPCDLSVPSEIDVQEYTKGNQSAQPGNEPQAFCSPPVLENDLVFDCEADSWLWETKANILMSNNDPLWCDVVDPPKCPILKRQKHSTHISTGDCSGVLRTVSKTNAERAVSTCQEPIQSTAEYAGKMASGPSVSASVSQPSPEAKPKQPMTSVSAESSVSRNAINSGAPQVTLTSTSGQNLSGQNPPAQPACWSQKVPPLAPVPKPARLSQKGHKRIKSLPPPAQPPAHHSQKTLLTQKPTSSTSLQVIHVVGPAQGTQGLVSGSDSMLRSTTNAPPAGGTQHSGLLPPESQQPIAGSGLFKNDSANFKKICPIGHLSDNEPAKNILDILENGACILKKEICPVSSCKEECMLGLSQAEI
ncbi:Protein FAM48A [Heterocephalus glaber]|uniref:Protein FAM48A n=1 Tax=Heterocephalus glaber TaxID=10181 RepID=G5BSC3_HETGA|nr:Protein FAM48A [Heterocephalus glaber]